MSRSSCFVQPSGVEMAKKIPNPCVDVCKYKREGHCIACSMTKPQKSLFKTLKKDKHREAFVHMLVAQQARMGKFGAWAGMYAKKCDKKLRAALDLTAPGS